MAKQIQDISTEELQKLLADGESLIERSKAVYIPTSAVEAVVSKIQKELERRNCQ
jgi:hypothetical protein